MILLSIAVSLLLLPQLALAGGFSFGKLFKMSREQEESIATEMNEEFRQEPGLIEQGEGFEQVQRIGQRIVERNGLEEYEYQFFLIDQEEVNAFATPAGYIYITQGLLDVMGYDESMLAGVVAHELGHARERHVAKGYEKYLQGALGLTVLGVLLGEENKDAVNVLFAGGQFVYLKYNRDQEEWADRAGVELNYGADYDAYGLMRGLECLQALYGSGGSIAEYLSSHPDTGSRITRTSGIAFELSGQQHGYQPIPRPPSEEHPLWERYKSGQPVPLKQTSPVEAGIGEAESYSR